MSPLIRRAGLSSSALVLALSLAACGGGGDESGSSSGSGSDAPAVLSKAEADSALLVATDLSSDFTELGVEESSGQDLGCLNGFRDLTDVAADTEAENNFELETEASVRNVMTAVNSYADTDTIVDAVETFRSSLEDCESIEVTDPESGSTLSLAVTVDDSPGIGETDDQVGFSGAGSITAADANYSYDVSFVVSRIDNAMTVVGVIDIGAPGEDLLDTLTETAVDRLNDAVA